ncbi:MAG: putative membrane protein [Akkermansiaceae bacterium]
MFKFTYPRFERIRPVLIKLSGPNEQSPNLGDSWLCLCDISNLLISTKHLFKKMTDSKHEHEDSFQENDPSETNQEGNAGRIFLSILVLVLAATAAAFASLRDGEFVQNLLGQDGWWSQLIGNLHPILMLFPLGLILLVLLVEVLGWLSFRKWKAVTVLALLWVVITTVLASVSGLVLMKLEGNSGPDWRQYLWYGIGAMAAFALSFLCKIWGRNRNGSGILYAFFFLGGIAALGYGGYIYGQKVHAYAVVPSPGELTTPFGNQKIREQMGASIAALEKSEVKAEALYAKQEEVINLSNSAALTAADQFRSEQQKVAMAQKDIVELNKNIKESQQKATEAQQEVTELQTRVTEAQKQTTEAQKKREIARKEVEAEQGKVAEVEKKLEAGNLENQKFQAEIKGLQSQIGALEKQLQDATEKQENGSKIEEESKGEEAVE